MVRIVTRRDTLPRVSPRASLWPASFRPWSRRWRCSSSGSV